jgi:hypothetical protein
MGLLKVDSKFVEDCESCFYTMLDLFKFYPKTIPSSNTLNASLNSIRKSYLFQSNSFTDQEIFKKERIKSFITDDQIDILISILAVIEKERFPVHEIGIMKTFGHYKSKELKIRREEYLNKDAKQKGRVLDVDDGYSDLTRFQRLRFLIYDLAEFNKKKVLQLLGLEASAVKHLLIKLGIEDLPNFENLPVLILRYFQVLKKLIFHFLIYFLLSKDYSYIHKFLVIAVFKSKE